MASSTIYPGTISADHYIYAFPKLIYTNARGKQNEWQVFVQIYNQNNERRQISNLYWLPGHFPEGWYATVTVHTGQVGGKIKDTKPDVIKAGKAKRNPFTQAVLEANEKYVKQSRSRDIVNREEIADYLPPPSKFIPLQRLSSYRPPMKFTDIYVQDKLDGVHAEAIVDDETGKVTLYSSQEKPYYASAICDILARVMDKDVNLDGELWAPGTLLQDITSAAKNPAKDSKGLVYMIYDAIFLKRESDGTVRASSAEDQYVRQAYIKQLVRNANSPLIQVLPSTKVGSLEEIEQYFRNAVDVRKNEGIVVRDFSLPYTPSYNKRKSDNMKYKRLEDDEFEIVGYTSGEKGKAAGLIMFICRTEEGKTFPVTPSRPEEWRRTEFEKCESDPEYFSEKYMGKMYTVQYANYSKDGVPVQPVGKVLEEEKQ